MGNIFADRDEQSTRVRFNAPLGICFTRPSFLPLGFATPKLQHF